MMTYKDMALVCATVASHPRSVFRSISDKHRREILQMFRESLVAIKFHQGSMFFKLSPLGQDIAREFSAMGEV